MLGSKVKRLIEGNKADRRGTAANRKEEKL
jgi:hypothetical protein